MTSSKPRRFANERKFKAAIVEDLHARGLLAWSAGAGAWMQSGRPDITGILIDGIRLDIEAKMPGEVPTELQAKVLSQLQQCNGEAFWCDTWERYIEQIEPIIKRHRRFK